MIAMTTKSSISVKPDRIAWVLIWETFKDHKLANFLGELFFCGPGSDCMASIMGVPGSFRLHRCTFRQTSRVIRKAFVMSIYPGSEAEYERRHRPIWPELEEVLLSHGVRTYSIFLDAGTRQLFGYVEFESEAQWQSIARTDVCQRWWKYMRELMPSNADNSPVSHELREVFHMDRQGGRRGE
jgi:L-rhamnose mutarotase